MATSFCSSRSTWSHTRSPKSWKLLPSKEIASLSQQSPSTTVIQELCSSKGTQQTFSSSARVMKTKSVSTWMSLTKTTSWTTSLKISRMMSWQSLPPTWRIFANGCMSQSTRRLNLSISSDQCSRIKHRLGTRTSLDLSMSVKRFPYKIWRHLCWKLWRKWVRFKPSSSTAAHNFPC